MIDVDMSYTLPLHEALLIGMHLAHSGETEMVRASGDEFLSLVRDALAKGRPTVSYVELPGRAVKPIAHLVIDDIIAGAYLRYNAEVAYTVAELSED